MKVPSYRHIRAHIVQSLADYYLQHAHESGGEQAISEWANSNAGILLLLHEGNRINLDDALCEELQRRGYVCERY